MKYTLDGNCESCLMPFAKDPKGVHRENEKYCSLCFKNGKLVYDGDDVKEFKKYMIEAMIKNGSNPLKAHVFAFMSGFAPRWKK